MDVAAEVLPAAPAWTPSLEGGRLTGGIVLSGKATADLQRALLGIPHVTSAQSVQVTTDGLRDSLGQFTGIAGGYGLLAWLVSTTIPSVMPDLGVTTALTGGSILAALLLGVGTVSIAPLFTLRRMRRMDIPSTLRLVE